MTNNCENCYYWNGEECSKHKVPVGTPSSFVCKDWTDWQCYDAVGTAIIKRHVSAGFTGG